MLVHVAMRGENGEGGSILGIFKRAEDAERVCLNQPAYAEGGWKRGGLSPDSTFWTNGCDWVEVRRMVVLG